MDDTYALYRGRESFDRHAWTDAFTFLSDADQQSPLDPEDLERLGFAAYLIGRDAESTAALSRAHQDCLGAGNVEYAIRCAFWLGFGLANRGEFALAGGWLARAQRLLDEGQLDCVERGYMLVPGAIQNFDADAANSLEVFSEICAIAQRFDDTDLTAIGRIGCGHALIRLGELDQGRALLDEVMVALTTGELSPLIVGLAYCAVIEICHEMYDFRRAQQWTDALTQWCESQPDLVPYRGECLVHRAEIMQLLGAWPDALLQAELACERLSSPPGQPSVGNAFYQRAQILRLRGEFQEAEEAYRQASQWGRTTQPGLALLRLAQGHTEAAEAAIRREVEELRDRSRRCGLLPAYIEVMLGVGDAESARAGADELAEIAVEVDAPPLSAASGQATGAVLLAEGDMLKALEALRNSWTLWQSAEIPYEAARVRVLIGQCCRELGDEDTAQMEFDAARWVFQQLGARPDLARVDVLARRTAPHPVGGLTAREVEVLRLVAAGKTNRAIAADLFLSEKTVARHMSNIFTKLGLSSRSAATAYAFEHDLV
jgi:DNA-binding CsgD family transcriptional regulator